MKVGVYALIFRSLVLSIPFNVVVGVVFVCGGVFCLFDLGFLCVFYLTAPSTVFALGYVQSSSSSV